MSESSNIKPAAPSCRSFVVSEKVCKCCQKENHRLFMCNKFQSFTVSERFNFVKMHKLCKNSLCYHASECNSTNSCKICNLTHHTLLHFKTRDTDSVKKIHDNQSGKSFALTNTTVNESSALDNAGLSPKTLSCNNGSCAILLGTVSLLAKDTFGRFQCLTGLLDPGSQSSLISKSCVDSLNLQVEKSCQLVSVIADTKSKTYGSTSLVLYKDYPKRGKKVFSFQLKPTIISEITDKLPAQTLPHAVLQKFQHLELADKKLNVFKEIHVLLGADIFCNFLASPSRGDSFIRGSPSRLYTKLGWVIFGTVTETLKSSAFKTFFV